MSQQREVVFLSGQYQKHRNRDKAISFRISGKETVSSCFKADIIQISWWWFLLVRRIYLCFKDSLTVAQVILKMKILKKYRGKGIEVLTPSRMKKPETIGSLFDL